MSDSTLRSWLRRAPQPAKLRVDETKYLRISNHPSRFSEAEKSVLAMNATTVEALDLKGDVLRVMQLRDPEEEVPAPQKEAWPTSNEAQLGQVITAACDRAASRHEAIFRMSFDALKQMYEACVAELQASQRRCAQLEAALQKEFARQEVQLPAADDESALNNLVAVLMPRLLAGDGGTAAKPNGKDPTQ